MIYNHPEAETFPDDVRRHVDALLENETEAVTVAEVAAFMGAQDLPAVQQALDRLVSLGQLAEDRGLYRDPAG